LVDKNTKVKFTLSIGYPTATQEDTFYLIDDLGYDPDVDIDIDEFLENAWQEWKNEYIDGSWDIE
jgi:hypothetical protein